MQSDSRGHEATAPEDEQQSKQFVTAIQELIEAGDATRDIAASVGAYNSAQRWGQAKQALLNRLRTRTH